MLDNILPVQITRFELAKWCHTDIDTFAAKVKGLFVRVSLTSTDPKVDPVYRVTRVTGLHRLTHYRCSNAGKVYARRQIYRLHTQCQPRKSFKALSSGFNFK